MIRPAELRVRVPNPLRTTRAHPFRPKHAPPARARRVVWAPCNRCLRFAMPTSCLLDEEGEEPDHTSVPAVLSSCSGKTMPLCRYNDNEAIGLCLSPHPASSSHSPSSV